MRKKTIDPGQVQQALEFSQRLLDTSGWINKAEELLAAACLLQPEIQKMWDETEVDNERVIRASERTNVQAQYFMLIAYAMENYFKALLVHRERKSLRNRLLTSLPRYLNKHDLTKLAQRVNLSLSVADEELLTRLSRNSIWAARYPVPTGPNGIRAMQQFSDGRRYLTAYFGPRDGDRIQEFMDRLRSFVTKETDVAA